MHILKERVGKVSRDVRFWLKTKKSKFYEVDLENLLRFRQTLERKNQKLFQKLEAYKQLDTYFPGT